MYHDVWIKGAPPPYFPQIFQYVSIPISQIQNHIPVSQTNNCAIANVQLRSMVFKFSIQYPIYKYLYQVKEIFIFIFQCVFHIDRFAKLCDPVLKVIGGIHYFHFTVRHRDVFHWLYHYRDQV